MILGKFNGWNVVTLPLTQLRSVDFTDHDVVGANTSPWNAQTQTYDWMQAFLSATVTLSTLTRAQMAAWTGALRSCRGPLNVFALGDPSLLAPLGVAGNNLAPDPGFNLPLGLIWSQPDPSWWIDIGTGYRGSNALSVATVGSVTANSKSQAISVIPNQSYTVSCNIDASGVTSSNPCLVVNDLTSTLLTLFGVEGLNTEYVGTFTAPSGVTSVTLNCFLGGVTSSKTIRFSAISMTAGAPLVNGAGQSGFSLITKGWPASVNNLLLVGDYFTMMSAGINVGDISVPRLYSVTEAVNSDSSGNATLNIWPPIRETPADATPLILTNTQGIFRLAHNQRQWNVNYDHTGSASFSILEAL